MKYIYLLSLLPLAAHAGFSKPELMARFMSTSAFNVPDGTWCFGGEPVAVKNRVYLNCLDSDSSLMGSWGPEGFKLLARTEYDQLFSRPVVAFNKATWYEFTETNVIRSYSAAPQVSKIELTNLSTMNEYNDSFYPLSQDSYFFKTKGDSPQLWIWKNNVVTSFLNPEAAYIFSPIVGPQGEIVLRTRHINLDESAPDKVWLWYNNQWKVILEDKNSNPSSPWISFRNQYVVEGNKILLVARDNRGDALILTDGSKTEIIAREGVELKRFDHFSPKMRAGTIVIRGENFNGQKVTYVKDNGPFRSLLSQGDIVKTDVGDGRVHYPNQDSIFYGAPGLDENGNVYLQATLTDADHPNTLLGVGLIKFNKE